MILTKTILCLILGFLSSLVLGFLVVPFFKKCHMYQSISKTISKRHLLKEGTPTMGGVIFIFSTLLITIFLFTISVKTSFIYDTVLSNYSK